MNEKFTIVEYLILLVVLSLLVSMIIGIYSGCDNIEKSSQKQGEEKQESVMKRAMKAHPVPKIDKFLTRKNMVKWMERMDQPGKLFYIYILSDTGSITHYFVAQYRPVSVNTYLTSPKRIHDDYDWGVTVPSPALDGTYYGSGGASRQYFFFDAETDAYIELKGLNYIISDQPFKVEAPQITIQKE